MSYRILNNKSFSSGKYQLVPIRDEDKYLIMKWRNEQIEILRQTERLTESMQEKYFKEVVFSDFSRQEPRQILFSYLHEGEFIGYGGLVHISWIDKRSEVSFLLETTRNNNIETFKKEYSVFLNLIKQVAFDELHLNKLTTEAFDLRPYLIETLELSAFVLEGRLKRHNFIKGTFVDSLLHACFNND